MGKDDEILVCSFAGECKREKDDNLIFRTKVSEKLDSIEKVLLEMKQDREKTSAEFWKVMKEMQQQIYQETNARLVEISSIKSAEESMRAKASGISIGVSILIGALTFLATWFGIEHK